MPAARWSSTFRQYGFWSMRKRRASHSTAGVNAAQIVVNVSSRNREWSQGSLRGEKLDSICSSSDETTPSAVHGRITMEAGSHRSLFPLPAVRAQSPLSVLYVAGAKKIATRVALCADSADSVQNRRFAPGLAHFAPELL